MTAPTAGGRRTRGTHAAVAAEDRTIEARLARVHLRGGMIALARAELEALVAGGALDTPALADLAEARWRSGDLTGAGAAAAAHLDEGGREPIAMVVAAEALAARGRTAEARTHAKRLMTALGPSRAEALEALFAGQPRGAVWPETEMGPLPESAEIEAAPEPEPAQEPEPALAAEPAPDPEPAQEPEAMADLTDGPSDPLPLPMPAAAPAVPAALVDDAELAIAGPVARDEIALIEADIVAGELRDVAVRLAIILRDGGGMAPYVLTLADRALAIDASPAVVAGLQLVRGDAFRTLGREVEAADAFARSRRALARRALTRQALERAIPDEGDR